MGTPKPARFGSRQERSSLQGVNDHLAARERKSYVRRVPGRRQAIEAGISDGDYVIARQQEAANSGDEIIVALLGDEVR